MLKLSGENGGDREPQEFVASVGMEEKGGPTPLAKRLASRFPGLPEGVIWDVCQSCCWAEDLAVQSLTALVAPPSTDLGSYANTKAKSKKPVQITDEEVVNLIQYADSLSSKEDPLRNGSISQEEAYEMLKTRAASQLSEHCQGMDFESCYNLLVAFCFNYKEALNMAKSSDGPPRRPLPPSPNPSPPPSPQPSPGPSSSSVAPRAPPSAEPVMYDVGLMRPDRTGVHSNSQGWYSELNAQAAAVKADLKAGRLTSQFIDPIFPPCTDALFKDPRIPMPQLPAVTWLRPRGFCRDPIFFERTMKVGDVMQGMLGDCWFLGVLAIVISRPDLAQELCGFAWMDLGVYIIKFFKGGEFVEVVVDDLIPCIHGSKIAFGRCRDPRQIWVPIIEKAYAKLHGCYEALVGGNESDAFMDLTGGITSHISLAEPDGMTHDLWKRLLGARNEGQLMAASSNGGSATGKGISIHHSYSVLNLAELNGVRLIYMRNPWGDDNRGIWTGDYSRGTASDKKLPNGMKDAIGYNPGEKGCFLISYEDFCRYFTSVNLCSIPPTWWSSVSLHGEWRGRTAGGSCNNPTWVHNPQFLLHVFSNTTVVLHLGKEDRRVHRVDRWREKEKYIGVIVLSNGRNDRRILFRDEQNVVDKCVHRNAREVCVTLNLKPTRKDSPLVIVPSMFTPDEEGTFWLRAISDNAVEVTPVPANTDWQSVIMHGLWDETLCGGSMKYDTWTINPQYVLSITTRDTYAIRVGVPDCQRDSAVGLYLLNGKPPKSLGQRQLKKQAVFMFGPEAGFEIDLDVGQYTLIPCTLDPGHLASFYVEVFFVAGRGVDLKPIAVQRPTSVPQPSHRAHGATGGTPRTQRNSSSNVDQVIAKLSSMGFSADDIRRAHRVTDGATEEEILEYLLSQ